MVKIIQPTITTMLMMTTTQMLNMSSVFYELTRVVN